MPLEIIVRLQNILRSFGVVLFFVLALPFWAGCNRIAPLKKIGLTQIASHPALDSVRAGVLKGLAERGFVEGQNIEVIFNNANGDPSLCLPIAQEFVRKGVDVIVPIATPSALAAAKSTDRIPIVFGGVTDPVGFGLVASLDHPGKNITGTSDRWPFALQMQLFAEILPTLKTVGILYRPGDDVSAIAIKEIQAAGQELNINVITMPVSSAGDLYRSAVALFAKADAIYTGLDGLVVENLESVLKAGREAHKPVLSGDVGTVERGGLATYSISMEELGRITGLMVADVLEGKSAGAMPVQIVSAGKAVVSRSREQEFGLNAAATVKSFTIEYTK